MARSPLFTRRLALPLLVFLVGAAAIVTAAYLALTPTSSGRAIASSVGGPFRLTTAQGATLTDADLKGTPFVVFFGFTHCPDICPTKLFEISEVLRAADTRGEKLRALFVTVDPERDTPAVLKDYLSSFDSRIVGLTGDPASVAAIVKAYRAYARKVPQKGDDYTMDHSTLVYLMNRRGEFHGALNLERPPAEAAKEWLALL
jgi:protein SCO1/2